MLIQQLDRDQRLVVVPLDAIIHDLDELLLLLQVRKQLPFYGTRSGEGMPMALDLM